MPVVVFTGAGKRYGSQTFTRIEWEALARANNWSTADKVGFGVDVLVASRTDTTKAADARRYSVDVLTYADFERRLYTSTPAPAENMRPLPGQTADGYDTRIRQVHGSRRGNLMYAVGNRTFSTRAAAERQQEENARAARNRSIANGTHRQEARAVEARRPTCDTHGVFLDSRGTCHECVAAESLARTRAEAARLEAAKLAPIGTLKGKRRMNLDGDD